MTKCCSSSWTSRPATKCEVTWTWTFNNHLSLTLLTHAKPSQNCYSMQKSKPICFFVEADSENNNGGLIAFFPTQLRIMPLSSGRRHNTLLTLLSCTSGHHPVLVESGILFHAKMKYISCGYEHTKIYSNTLLKFRTFLSMYNNVSKVLHPLISDVTMCDCLPAQPWFIFIIITP